MITLRLTFFNVRFVEKHKRHIYIFHLFVLYPTYRKRTFLKHTNLFSNLSKQPITMCLTNRVPMRLLAYVQNYFDVWNAKTFSILPKLLVYYLTVKA